VLFPGRIEVTGPGVTYQRFSKRTMVPSGERVLIDEHGRVGKRAR